MTPIRRLDHVAIAVESTEAALEFYAGRLGLSVVSTEELETPRVRLTYLDTGNAFLQLVEPLDGASEIARFLREHGEGLHHICFGVDDVRVALRELDEGDAEEPQLGQGRGRPSGFLGAAPHGTVIECTRFERAADVDERPGWLTSGGSLV